MWKRRGSRLAPPPKKKKFGEENVGGHILPDFKTYYKDLAIKMSEVLIEGQMTRSMDQNREFTDICSIDF